LATFIVITYQYRTVLIHFDPHLFQSKVLQGLKLCQELEYESICAKSQELQVLCVTTFVFGLQPVANITCENPPKISLLVFRDNRPAFDLVIAWGGLFCMKCDALKDICSAMKSLTCASKTGQKINKEATPFIYYQRYLCSSKYMLTSS